MGTQEKLIDLVDKVKDNLLNIKVCYATMKKIGATVRGRSRIK